VLAGLRDHQGPILTIANWSGQWPKLVGLLNLNGSLTKMGVTYSTIWSEDFRDEFFLQGIRQCLREGTITHDTRHVRDIDPARLPQEESQLGAALTQQLNKDKAILCIFDEGCMGMYNAIIDDELLNPCGIYRERFSQSALVAEMRNVSEMEAQAARTWLDKQAMRFHVGSDDATELTNEQVLEQLKMYIAAVRMQRTVRHIRDQAGEVVFATLEQRRLTELFTLKSALMFNGWGLTTLHPKVIKFFRYGFLCKVYLIFTYTILRTE